MALLISHRGNINGIVPEKENTVEHIEEALEKGFHVVVDVFLIGEKHLALGSETPQYPITIDFLTNKKIICRAKSIEALDFLVTNQAHAFYQEAENCSLTSGGLIWVSQGKNITQRCVFAMPEWIMPDITTLKNIDCAGICSNFIEKIKNSRN